MTDTMTDTIQIPHRAVVRTVYESVTASTVRDAVEEAARNGASLEGADLRYADLYGADLRGARLDGATMPDGRPWESYRLDHLAGICDEPEVRRRAFAARGNHEWGSCPMSAAHGWRQFGDAPANKRLLVGCWVACFDAALFGDEGWGI